MKTIKGILFFAVAVPGFVFLHLKKGDVLIDNG